jgi:large subunit ribosomal protein L28
MATYCEVTGRKPGFGKSVSHSHRRTNRRFDPNLQSKRFYLASENRWIRLTVSTKGIKTSTAGTGYTYVTRKNRRNDPDRLLLEKYDPRIRRHVDFREER